MPGLTVESLDSAQSALNAALRSDPVQLDRLTRGIDGLREAIAKGYDASPGDLSDVLGEAVIKDGETYDAELSDVLGEVVIQKSSSAPASPETAEPFALFEKADAMSDDYYRPILRDLFERTYTPDGTLRKSADEGKVDFQKAYEDLLVGGEGMAEGIVNATIEEIAKSNPALMQGLDRNYDEDERDEDEGDMEKFLKGADPSVVAYFTKMQSTIDGLKAERDLERFVKTAEDIGEGAAFGKTLMAVHSSNPEHYEEITKRLRSKNEMLRKSDLGGWGREVGGGGATNGEASSAVAQLNARATEMVSKGLTGPKGRPLTFAQAFTKACEDYPDLYREYHRDREARRA